MQKRILFVLLFFLISFPHQAEARRRSNSPAPKPSIISRAQWGADESLGLMREPTDQIADQHSHGELSDRDKKCQEAKNRAPEDFRIERTEKGNGHGFYSWERRYSPKVKKIVVHHTGEHRHSDVHNLKGKKRIGAIYYSHAVKNGWGDIGYHYLIDDDGKIYEGRAGGKYVIGAHVYCANVATIGVALIGNFQFTYPSEVQLRSLRKLIAHLGDEYNINVNGKTRFQGKLTPTVVSHRDLAPTQCAGRKTQKLLPKIRQLSATQDFRSPMLLTAQKRTQTRRTTSSRQVTENILSPVGTTTLRMPARGAATIKMTYKAGKNTVKAGSSLAKVKKSDSSIGLWHKRKSNRVRVRNDIRSEKTIRKGEDSSILMTVLAPRNSGTYTLQIGETTYRLEVEGRRMRSR